MLLFYFYFFFRHSQRLPAVWHISCSHHHAVASLWAPKKCVWPPKCSETRIQCEWGDDWCWTSMGLFTHYRPHRQDTVRTAYVHHMCVCVCVSIPGKPWLVNCWRDTRKGSVRLLSWKLFICSSLFHGVRAESGHLHVPQQQTATESIKEAKERGEHL